MSSVDDSALRTSIFDKPSVLVVVASKHGATTELALHIAEVLRSDGFRAHVEAADDVGSLHGHAGVVIGSAVYAGHWQADANRFIKEHQEELRKASVWLFSSGPLGDPPKPQEEPREVWDLMDATGALGHRVFAGRLDKNQLNLSERTVARVVNAPYGDFRDWEEVGAWALEIAAYLRARVSLGR